MISMADVIDLAINEHLWNGTVKHSTKATVRFSCEAVYQATNRNDLIAIKIEKFLQSMGLDPQSVHEFEEIKAGKKRQYARALWLTLASMIAREEEIEGLMALAELGRWLLEKQAEPEFIELRSEEIEDTARDFGLLEQYLATDPCGDQCYCNTWALFPRKCVRLTDKAKVLDEEKP